LTESFGEEVEYVEKRGLAYAVRPDDDVERAERKVDLLQGAVATNRDTLDRETIFHVGLIGSCEYRACSAGREALPTAV
jgi:hypothetical protein